MYLFALEEELKRMGHSVAQFAMHDPDNKSSPFSKYFVQGIDYDNAGFVDNIKNAFKIIYSMEARRNIARLLDAYRPDVAHLHIFQHQLSPSILPELKKRGVPIIYTAHDLKSVCPNYKMLTHGQICELCRGRDFYHCFFNQCTKESAVKSFVNVIEMYVHKLMGYYELIDLIITPSAFYREKLIQYRFPEEKVVHIPNFVDERKYVPKYKHQGYFAYLGRLSEEKGISTLIDAMRQVKHGKLKVIGTGPLEAHISDSVRSSGLKNVELVGFQSGEPLRELIRNSMFTVLPSEWYENGPMSLIESFAYGKPVIGSNIGGIPEHICDGKDGLLFEPGNAKDLAEKIDSMSNNPDRTIEMGKEARKKAETCYSKNTHMKAILDIYGALVS